MRSVKSPLRGQAEAERVSGGSLQRRSLSVLGGGVDGGLAEKVPLNRKKGAGMEPDELAQKSVSLIPEIYYDIIARILPGGLTLFGATYLLERAHLVSMASLWAWFTTSFAAGSMILAVCLGSSYALGIVLTPFGRPLIQRIELVEFVWNALWHRGRRTHDRVRQHGRAILSILFARCRCPASRKLAMLQRLIAGRSRNNHLITDHTPAIMKALSGIPRDALGPGVSGLPSIVLTGRIRPRDRFELDHYLYEYVRIKCSQASITAKMRAEMGCCRNLVVVCAVLLVLSLLMMPWTHSWKLPLVLSLCFPFVVQAESYRAHAYYERLLTFVYLIAGMDRACDRPTSGAIPIATAGSDS